VSRRVNLLSRGSKASSSWCHANGEKDVSKLSHRIIRPSEKRQVQFSNSQLRSISFHFISFHFKCLTRTCPIIINFHVTQTQSNCVKRAEKKNKACTFSYLSLGINSYYTDEDKSRLSCFSRSFQIRFGVKLVYHCNVPGDTWLTALKVYQPYEIIIYSDKLSCLSTNPTRK